MGFLRSRRCHYTRFSSQPLAIFSLVSSCSKRLLFSAMLARVLPLRMTYAGALLVALSLLLPYRAVAHDIPNDVMVQAFVRPAGRRPPLVGRVPLHALRRAAFPA